MPAVSSVVDLSFVDLNPPYSTIVADPPWKYRSKDITTRTSHGTAFAEANYSTMSNEEIAELPVGELAADDAHIYLWVTNPKLFGDRRGGVTPVEMIEGWGFRYITLITWHKTPAALGMGFYFRGQTEHVVFGVKGKLPIPSDRRERNIFDAPTSGHSVKPPAFFDLVERVSPGPYLELFARQPRLGWDSWGLGFEQVAEVVQ